MLASPGFLLRYKSVTFQTRVFDRIFQDLSHSALQTENHFTSPFSIRKVLLTLGLNPWPSFCSLSSCPLSHQAMRTTLFQTWVQTMNLWRRTNLLQSRPFYNFFLYEKNTASFGLEPLTSYLQLKTLFTKPAGHVLIQCFRLNQYLRFLDLNIFSRVHATL